MTMEHDSKRQVKWPSATVVHGIASIGGAY